MSTKVLVVDDEESVCNLLAELLQFYSGYEVTTETDGRNVLALLEQYAFDVVLLDIVMPAIDGIELLRLIKQRHEELPVIIVTGRGSVETAVESMLAGAADFVSKSVEGVVLNLRLQKVLENAQIKRLSGIDSLTGLANHRTFQQRLSEEVERANRYHRALSLLLIDLDHFKRYNEIHGYMRGDTVLMELAWLLQAESRTTDIVSRCGGEEFALLLPETDSDQALSIANRLRQSIANHKFPGEDLLPGKVLTGSIGVATHVPFFGTKEGLLKAAEMALLVAKQEGRNCVRTAT